MSREILHGLLNGKILPWERRNPKSEKRSELLKKIESEERYFVSKMSLDDCARFEELTHLHMQLVGIEEDDNFAYSFTLGMLLMKDIMEEAEVIYNS